VSRFPHPDARGSTPKDRVDNLGETALAYIVSLRR
jgi:hypothetical protein